MTVDQDILPNESPIDVEVIVDLGCGYTVASLAPGGAYAFKRVLLLFCHEFHVHTTIL